MSRIDIRTRRTQSIRPRVAQRRRGGGGGRGQGGGGGGGAGRGGDAPAANAAAADQQAAIAAIIAAGGFGGGGGVNFATSNVVPAPAESDQYRFYWNTPLVLSPHNPRLIYTA